MNATDRTTDTITNGPHQVVGADELRAWIERVAGPVQAWEQIVSGNSRTTWSAEITGPDGPSGVIVRAEAGDGPFAGTELTLEREAIVYRALEGRGLRTPRLLAFDPELNAIAMSRLPGSPEWSDSAFDGYLAELGRLHSVEVDSLTLPGFCRTAADDLELWARVSNARFTSPSPYVDFAFPFLRETFPGEPERLVLCHGDTGPGNFLHDGSVTTGLLDWEFAHIGDPIDDLAWISVRAALFGIEIPRLGGRIRAHYTAMETPLRADRLRYWQAVVILRNLVTCLASIANPARGRDRLVHFMLVPSLNRMLVGALARIVGVSLEPAAPPKGPAALPGGPVLREVALSLGELASGLTERDQHSRAKRMRYLLSQLAETWTLAADIAKADAAEGPAATDPAERLRQLGRMADRQLALFPRARKLADTPIQGLD